MNRELSWLMEPAPHRTLAAFRASGALAKLLPEGDALYGIQQNPTHHPEVCTGAHIELCLEMAERLGLTPAARFAVLVHDLGKALTPANELPRHVGHERHGLTPVAAVCARFHLDERTTRLALLMCEFHLQVHRVLIARSRSLLHFLVDNGLEQDRALLEELAGACEADMRGRLGLSERPYPQGQVLREAHSALQQVPTLAGYGPSTRQGDMRHKERLGAIRQVLDRTRPGPSSH